MYVLVFYLRSPFQHVMHDGFITFLSVLVVLFLLICFLVVRLYIGANSACEVILSSDVNESAVVIRDFNLSIWWEEDL